jgi:very-short-patch-repair endonuclease
MAASQKSTYLKKYGKEHPMMVESVMDKFKTSMLKKYGESSALKVEKFIEKSKKTKTERYGDENYNNEELRKATCVERYGVDNPGKIKSVVDQAVKTKLNNHYDFLVKFCDGEGLDFLCEKDNYKGYHFSHDYEFRCRGCKKIFLKTAYSLKNIFCDYCHPEKITSVEKEIYEFLQSVTDKDTLIIRRDRTVLNGKELDFYIPSNKLAIEMNGLYWHSEHGGGIHKNYHLNKTKSCACHGISLLHVFENEWLDNSDIVKSIVKTTLGKFDKRIYARDCEVVVVDNVEKNSFLNKNHLQGEDKSTIKLGLKNEGELVSVMTFRRTSRFEKNIEWELTRFCNRLNTSVVGGASKLFQHFLKENKPKMVVSYCDRRFFSGRVYGNLGFKFVKHTSPGYHIIVNKYKGLRHRMGFQKYKLSKVLNNFDPSKIEWDNLVNNGLDRIWDCGHSKWIFTNPSVQPN